MQIAHSQPIPQPNIQIFEAMKAGIDITTLLPSATTFEYYLYIKSYKLIDKESFFAYCQQHKGNEFGKTNPNATKFLLMLYAILDENYPPLEHCHEQQDGYIGLDDYVKLATQIFNQ